MSLKKLAANQITLKMPGDPTAAVDAFNKLVDAYQQYAVVVEQEKTKRDEIAAKREIALECIRSQRELMLTLMNHTFKERAAALEIQYNALDHALASGNNDVVHSALNAIVETVKSSPFKNLQDLRTKMSSKDYTIDLD